MGSRSSVCGGGGGANVQQSLVHGNRDASIGVFTVDLRHKQGGHGLVRT